MYKPKILIVEDDPAITSLLRTTLDMQEYQYHTAKNGAGALLEAVSYNADVIILDLGLPDMDGVDIIHKIRTWSSVPIIVVSARSEDADKVGALDAGADDYIAKPFGMMELLSRIRALARRTSEKPSTYQCGCLCVDEGRHTVTVEGHETVLTQKEFELLCLLLQNRGQVFSRERLIEQVWGYAFTGETRTVDVHIRTLRQKLGPAGAYIQTVRGYGYKIDGEG